MNILVFLLIFHINIIFWYFYDCIGRWKEHVGRGWKSVRMTIGQNLSVSIFWGRVSTGWLPPGYWKKASIPLRKLRIWPGFAMRNVSGKYSGNISGSVWVNIEEKEWRKKKTSIKVRKRMRMWQNWIKKEGVSLN